MLVHLLKSKLHRATVTAASLDYEGSLTIAEDLMERAGLHPYERILCGNMANGARWDTYAIRGPRGRWQAAPAAPAVTTRPSRGRARRLPFRFPRSKVGSQNVSHLREALP